MTATLPIAPTSLFDGFDTIAVQSEAAAENVLDALAPLLATHLTGHQRESLQHALVDLIDLRIAAATPR